MTTPASHRRKPAQQDYFPPVPDGAIPTQHRPEVGVHRATASPGRGRMAAGVALVLAAAAGAGWMLLGSSGADGAAAAGVSGPLVALDGDAPRITGRIPVGTFHVGHEVEAGVYRSAGAAALAGPAGCRWQVDAGPGPLVTGGTSTGPVTVTLRPGAGEFTSTGCQDWVQLG